MAIQETALNKWLTNAELIDDKYCISEVMTRDQFHKLINKEQCEFSEKELSVLKEYSRELDFDMTTLDEVTAELDDNLVQFPFENALKLYLEKVYKKNFTAIEAVEMGFDYYDIEKKNLEIFTFDIWTEKGNFSEEYNKLLVNIPMMYLNSAIGIVKSYRAFGEYIQAKIRLLNPLSSKQPATEESSLEDIQIDDFKNPTHKLLFFHKLGLYEPLYKKYYNHLGPENFARLVAKVISVPEKAIKNRSFKNTVSDLDEDINYYSSKNKDTSYKLKVHNSQSIPAVRNIFNQLGLEYPD